MNFERILIFCCGLFFEEYSYNWFVKCVFLLCLVLEWEGGKYEMIFIFFLFVSVLLCWSKYGWVLRLCNYIFERWRRNVINFVILLIVMVREINFGVFYDKFWKVVVILVGFLLLIFLFVLDVDFFCVLKIVINFLV